METRLRAQQKAATSPSFTPVSGGMLQRKCACGGTPGPTGECEACRKKKLQRRVGNLAAPSSINHQPSTASQVPPIVREVLRSQGQPLDRETRAFMEPRFGHDFSHVRVHTDARASESARVVDALAYTVGREVVFGAGQYVPETRQGRQLLAHELTHVVQQASAGHIMQAEPGIGGRNNSVEREADEMASNIMAGMHVGPVRPDAQTLRRQDPIDVELVPATPESREENKKLGIDLPKVSEGVWRIIGGVADNAKKSLIEPERKNIETILKKAKIPTGDPLASPLGGRFLLHDTSAPVGAASIQAQQSKGRGPLGSGVSAYVPAQGDATMTRPDFFETKRPSTTEFEKNIESFQQPADAKLSSGGDKAAVWKKRRDALFRDVWNTTQASKQDQAFNKALAGMQLTPAEIQEERTGNKKPRQDPDFNPGIEAIFKAGSSERATTSASWTIQEICRQVNPATTTSVAVSGKEKDLTDACNTLSGYFTERDKRVSSTVSVEIVQPGVISKGQKQKAEDAKAKLENRAPKEVKVNDNTCDPTSPDIVPLSNPPYSSDQYENISLLYLRAAFIAGMFPEITTHYAVDRFLQGHCDPRCFNLNQLYDLIAAKMAHGKGSTYGVTPDYGPGWKTHNVWWDDKICHGKHP
jgi:hypothetical protein